MVNLATETARRDVPGRGAAPGDLISVVEQAGYTAALAVPAEARTARPTGRAPGEKQGGPAAAAAAGVAGPGDPGGGPGHDPGVQFRYWQWVALALATPVVLWGAWPFHRAALANARHGVASMDTLISVGVAAAYLWSLYALLFGAAGRAGRG